ncbi:MAG TPA: imidazoleglycerol-phosphate dehydratase HisB [bacterium]|nr:imidazoleglycerol-phosphate dehydratase HisB [bacterium]HEX67665.1 imidazoleglycerol-phosphate dehydratase HisB [bacterium]
MRKVKKERVSKETKVFVEINLDGKGEAEIRTGIPFFDHMLELFSRHGLFDLKIEAQGDIEVDFHHTVEDVGITLGESFKEALGDKKGITRYGWAFIPMDESLSQVVVDISSRPQLVFKGELRKEKVGSFDTELLPVFLEAFALHAGLTLHVNIFYGENLHHMIESVFKALGRALRMAVKIDEREKGIPSTKGIL